MSHLTLQEQVRLESATTAAELTRPPGILVIEDERLILKALDQGLRKRGFSVWAAANGGTGVELYRRFEDRIDVVLSDLNMPILNGPETLAALREINPAVRFCFMTGDTRRSTLDTLVRRGAQRVFTKPFASLAEVADQLWELATRPPASSDSLALGPEEDTAHDEPASPELMMRPPGGEFFGSILSPLVWSIAYISLPWGKKSNQSGRSSTA